METVLQQFVEQILAQSVLEYVAVLFAMGYVWLAARQNIWCWPCALISTGLFTWIFWEVSLPFHTALNAYYLLMAIYGWFKWNTPEKILPVSSWPIRTHVMSIVGLAALSLILSIGVSEWFSGDYVYLDAFITVFSVFTTILVAHKVLENWLYWMVINSTSVFLFYAKGLYPTAALSLIYLAFSVYGYIQWQRDVRSAEPQAA